MAPTLLLHVYDCSAVELRAEERRLIVAGADIVLRKHAFDLLLMVVEEQPRVVCKGELLARVWPRMVVEANNLTVQMSNLRKHLGPDVIATAPGPDYRRAVPLKSPPPRADAVGFQYVVAQPPARIYDALPGRSAELALLQEALLQHRLVTMPDLGGVGKTALASACWHEQAGTHRGDAGGACRRRLVTQAVSQESEVGFGVGSNASSQRGVNLRDQSVRLARGHWKRLPNRYPVIT